MLSATLCSGFHRAIEGETLGVATVRYANGALGTITMTTLSYKGFPERVDVSGTKEQVVSLVTELTSELLAR